MTEIVEPNEPLQPTGPPFLVPQRPAGEAAPAAELRVRLFGLALVAVNGVLRGLLVLP
jgi:hypothetical protein